jgi:hypothetical protein
LADSPIDQLKYRLQVASCKFTEGKDGFYKFGIAALPTVARNYIYIHPHLNPPPSIRGRKVTIIGKMPVLHFSSNCNVRMDSHFHGNDMGGGENTPVKQGFTGQVPLNTRYIQRGRHKRSGNDIRKSFDGS